MFEMFRRLRPQFSLLVRPRILAADLAIASALLVAGCGGGSGGGSGFWPSIGIGPAAQPPASSGAQPDAAALQTPAAFQVKTLSSPPDMISGGDTLLEVVVPEGVALDKVRISLNGADVSAQVPVADSAARVLRGLVTGLATDASDPLGKVNMLVVSNGDDAAQHTDVKLVNYPITGPILSGPHLSPYECRTKENNLGDPLDADCSAKTQVVWYYRTKSGAFVPLTDPVGPRPVDLVTTTTNDGTTVPYIVRVESGTINRGVYRLAVLDDPSKDAPVTWKPGAGWNKKLVVSFGVAAGVNYNQGVQEIGTALSDIELSRGFAYMNSTELVNSQHTNPHLQGETLMMLKEHVIEEFGTLPKWTVGTGGSGGAIQQYQIAQLFPGLLDGLQPAISFPDSQRNDVAECRLLNRLYASDPGAWSTCISFWGFSIPQPSPKQAAVSGFAQGVCNMWDMGFVNFLKSDVASNCGFQEPANLANVFNRATNPNGVRCDIFQTNVNLLGKRPGTQEAQRPLDNVGVQFGLVPLNSGTLSVKEFLDLNEKIGGFDRDGNPQVERSEADADVLWRVYAGGFLNQLKGPGLANVPIVTQRSKLIEDIHDLLQDLIIRDRLQRANGRSDNQIIWASSIFNGVNIQSTSLDLINQWLDNMAADPAPASTDKVVRNKPAGANDACWDASGKRIDEAASNDPKAACNVLYPRFSNPRIQAGAPLAGDIVKCQLKPVNPADYAVSIQGADLARLQTIFRQGVCDWSKPGVGQQPLRGTYLRLPLAAP